MNLIRERVLLSIPRYSEFSEYKDLITFCICSEQFSDREDEDNGIEPDFDEVIAIVEKAWLFDYINKSDPPAYLKNEYISDDSIDWLYEAIRNSKIVMVEFN